MAEFKLTNKAVEDLSLIWDYTLGVWSENQADKYYEMLISTCQVIVYNPVLGKNYDGITQYQNKKPHNKPYIIYAYI